MTKREDIVVEGGHLRGCRGRVRMALIILALLVILLIVTLVRSMQTATEPIPVKQASAEFPREATFRA